MTNQKAIIFVKFGEKERIETFQKEGLLYMNPLEYFRNLRNEPQRGDENECITHLFQPNKIKILVNGEQIKQEDIIGPILQDNNSQNFSHMFCMSCLSIDASQKQDSKLFNDAMTKGWGDTILVIYNATEFMNRLNKKIESFKIKQAKQVEYIDPKTYHGVMGPFRKFNEFSHQKEWRLILDASQNKNDAYKLFLGSIEDISRQMPIAEFKNEIIQKSNEIFINF